jgi:alpha-L-rhamnosidase
MMGSVGSWFYKYVLGIVPSADHPGFEQFVINPYIFEDLEFVEGQLNTIRGSIKVSWHKEKNNLLKMDVAIPPNSTAIVTLPTDHPRKIREGEKSITRISEIEIVGEENGHVLARIGSGEWSFEIRQ